MSMFSELSITSNFSFLQGASHPEEYMERALLGLSAIAIADVNLWLGSYAHTHGQKIKETVSERQQIEPFDLHAQST